MDIDITALKMAVQALRRSDERLSFAVVVAHVGWFDGFVQTGATEVGPEYPRMLGFEPEEFHTSLPNWLESIHPDDLPAVQAILRQVLETGQPGTGEYRRRTRTGEWKWFYTSGAVAERDASGKPVRLTGIHMDVSQRKQAEAELAEYRQHLEELRRRTAALSETNQQLAQTQFGMARRDRY
jgi:PAS domain S-box-containing protein